MINSQEQLDVALTYKKLVFCPSIIARSHALLIFSDEISTEILSTINESVTLAIAETETVHKIRTIFL
ncbi:MAG: hypothetical protein LBS66_04235 [Rhodospirillaceae bacterium]|nr:hypothetical protein [Rhodospirillaceae bacterium]